MRSGFVVHLSQRGFVNIFRHYIIALTFTKDSEKRRGGVVHLSQRGHHNSFRDRETADAFTEVNEKRRDFVVCHEHHKLMVWSNEAYVYYNERIIN